jgi:NADPH:quinone reductase-like Zn-dependent oxidoreductase
MGVISNGGFAEYTALPERNAFKMPDDMSWELAASMSVAALTPHHALNKAQLKASEYLVVFGASGNTGMFAVQQAKRLGAHVVAVTRKDWLKDYGADNVVRYEDANAEIRKIDEEF